MSAHNGFIELVKDVLRGLGPVSVKRMFGGAGIYADGVMFGLLDGDALYFKTDATTQAAFEAEGQQPFVYDGATGPVTMSYWRVPERLYDDPDEITEWARRALGVARAAAARKLRSGKRAPAVKKRKAVKRPRAG